MTTINSEGYLERITKSGKKNPHGKSTKRNWWLVKCYGSYTGKINPGMICFPKWMKNKRVRFKVEVIEDEIPDRSDKEI